RRRLRARPGAGRQRRNRARTRGPLRDSSSSCSEFPPAAPATSKVIRYGDFPGPICLFISAPLPRYHPATIILEGDAMKHLIPVALIVVAASTLHAAVQTKTIEYKQGDTKCVGFLAWDDSIQSKAPGVLVIP